MGQSDSLPAIEADMDSYISCGADISMIPYFIPEDHTIARLDLAGSPIRAFPTSLKRLRFVDLSNCSLNTVNWEGIDFDFPELETLSLARNGLRALPPPVMKMTSLKSLVLNNNALEGGQMDLRAFTSLETLDIFQNFVREVPLLPESIITLNLGFNKIMAVDMEAPNLQTLKIPGNEITEFAPKTVFSGLLILDFSMNRLVELPPISRFAPKLVELICPHNFLKDPLTELPTTLKKIIMSHNVLESLGDELEGLPSLETLEIEDNRIAKIPNLPVSVIRLSAENNVIREFVPQCMNKLSIVRLAGNKVEELPNIRDTKTSVLNMRGNAVTVFESEKLNQYARRIDVSSNQIREIPLSLCEFKSIRSLNLACNGITSVPKEIAKMRLDTLLLSENSISELPALPQTIRTIVCIRCGFTAIPESVLAIPRLGIVDFSCNEIENVPTLPNATNINLSMNKISHVPQLTDVISKLDLSCNMITEVVLSGEVPPIQELDLSVNRITMLQTPVLSVLGTLRLACNPLKGKLNVANFPLLETLDITNTNLTLKMPLPVRMKECSTSDQKLFSKAKSRAMRLYQCANAGYAETIGTRATMEDSLVLRTLNTGRGATSMDIYAVIDGHGGSETANIAASLIPLYFEKGSGKSVVRMGAVLRDLNATLLSHNVKDGAVLAFCVVTPEKVGCAHVGDSRALIVRKNGTAVPLTLDHKATERCEIDLLKENGTYVETGRTAGILAVSRAIGDFQLSGLSRIPAITSYKRKPDDFRLVLACDGVFDVIDNSEVAAVVATETDVVKTAYLLRNLATARGSQDNISAIVVDIQQH